MHFYWNEFSRQRNRRGKLFDKGLPDLTGRASDSSESELAVLIWGLIFRIVIPAYERPNLYSARDSHLLSVYSILLCLMTDA
jgi:hypothetical protein